MSKNKLLLILSAILAVLLGVIYFLYSMNKDIKAELAESNQNVETLIAGQKQYKINDSLNASKIKALELSKKDAERYVGELQKQIQNGKKEKVVTYTQVVKHDTMYFPISDTVLVHGDTCFGYNDRYMSFLYCGDSAYIEQHDTIKQVITKAYKHKFLWWRFGSDGINQHIWSTNPRSHIIFDKFIKYDD